MKDLFEPKVNMSVIRRLISSGKTYSVAVSEKIINDKKFKTDEYTNISPNIISKLNRNLFNDKQHPICLIKERIIHYFYNGFRNTRGNAVFSVHDDLCPIVTTQQNFDSLLVPKNHASRAKSDCYYINKEWLLRSHMTAHQSDLIKMGLNNFLMVGDVYRRDKIDYSHFPVFHQLDGVRLLTPEELLRGQDNGMLDLNVREKEDFVRTEEKQEVYSLNAVKMVEAELKEVLEGLSRELFGNDVKHKWVKTFFPFTHPSWELEVMMEEKWVEVLGCGVIEHKILENAGCENRIGWAFGLGLDRLAMVHYSIPDIRILWSQDLGFLNQFEGKTWADKVTFKPFSVYPACPFDVSFWIDKEFSENDFYELVRKHCGDIIEHAKLVSTYVDARTGRESRCYRLHYRSMEKTLTKAEILILHKELENKLEEELNVVVR